MSVIIFFLACLNILLISIVINNNLVSEMDKICYKLILLIICIDFVQN